MSEFRSNGYTVALTPAELGVLSEILDAGDRGSFYITYYSMTDSAEALLQSKIATFSGLTGGAAFIANRYLQDVYGVQDPDVPPDSQPPLRYPGIYYLSQKVALSALDVIKQSASDSDGVGLVSDAEMFDSANLAWIKSGIGNASIEDLFPGNLIKQPLSQLLQLNLADINTPGAYAAVTAIPYASYFGKKISDFPASSIVTLAGGLQVAVDQNGAIQAVFATVPEDYKTALAAPVMSVLAPVDEVLLDHYFGDTTPQSNAQEAAIRAGLKESHAGYNGDVNPVLPQQPYSERKYALSTAGTDEANLILTDESVSGEGGDDLIVGGAASQSLSGGSGNDIIWGRGGVDRIDGGSGNDVIRGGAGDDVLIGGAGDDLIDGGDINLKGSEDGTDTVDYSAADGAVTIDFTGQARERLAQHIIDVANDGFGNKDELHSVEKFVLSGKEDFIKVGKSSDLDGVKEVDAGAGKDTIDFSNDSTAVTIDRGTLSGSTTILKNFEVVIGTNFADTFKLSSGAELGNIEKLDAGGQAAGTYDTLDFSQMDGDLGVTVVDHRILGLNTRIDNFEQIVGTKAADNIEYSEGAKGIEVFGGSGNDHIKTGEGDDTLDGGADIDVLEGGAGFDKYFVTNGDTITDSDGRGSVTAPHGVLTGGRRMKWTPIVGPWIAEVKV